MQRHENCCSLWFPYHSALTSAATVWGLMLLWISHCHGYSYKFAFEMKIIEKPQIKRQFCIIAVLSRYFHNPLTTCVYNISSLWIQLPSEKNLFEKSWWMQQICKHEHTGISTVCLFACSEISPWSVDSKSDLVQVMTLFCWTICNPIHWHIYTPLGLLYIVGYLCEGR